VPVPYATFFDRLYAYLLSFVAEDGEEKLTPEGEDKRFIFQAAKLGVYGARIL
jgi:hypothetical protein